MRKTSVIWGAAILFALVLQLQSPAQIASAHANLVASVPQANTVLDDPPNEIRLTFSETPEVKFTQIELLDQSNRVLVSGDTVQADPNNAKVVSIALDYLPHGVYTVTWHTVSATDGHSTAGAFAFAIGKEMADSLKPAVAPTTSQPDPINIISRWFSYLSMALLAGVFAFVPLVIRYKAKNTEVPTDDLIHLLYIGWWLAIIATLAAALTQAELVGGLAALPTVLTGSRYGLLLLVRFVLLVILGGLILTRRREGPIWWWLGFSISLAVLFTISLGSHADATESPLIDTLADWLHLAATNIWLGGLVALSRTLFTLHTIKIDSGRSTGKAISRIVSRFSDIAAACIFVIVATGTYRAIYEIAAPSNLLDTPYGQVLGIKLLLFVPLLGLGALNLFIVKPRMVASITKSETTLYDLLMRSVGFEIVFVTAVLFMTGILTSLEPARDNFGSDNVTYQQADDLRVILAVSPAQPGLNTFDVYLREGSGTPPQNVQEVSLIFSMVERDMGETQITMTDAGNGHYTAQGGYTGVAGTWHIRATVRRTGRDDTQAAFTLPLTVTGVAPAPPPVNSVSTLVGLVIAADGILLAYWSRRLGGLRRWGGRAAIAAAFVSLVFGFTISIRAYLYDNTGGTYQNVVAADSASIARGKAVFTNNCAGCHGDSGLGNGPAAASLPVQPANLQVHANAHSSEQLFTWISQGFGASGMPAFETRLSERDRWDVINYIRTLGSSQ